MRADSNRRFYERSFIGARYARQSELQPAEAAILDRLRDELAGARILDLGVGGGRTTPHLLQLSRDYVGLDYSSQMIARCRKRFPNVDFKMGDARDLSAFPDESFDLVLFSYNGIDAASHAHRMEILAEVRRVLRPGGLFIFSSHNRNFQIPKPWDARHLAVNPLRHPLHFARRVATMPVAIIHYLRNSQLPESNDEYCMAVDSAYLYSLRHYWITLAAQQRQLERFGFRVIDFVGIDGRSLAIDESATLGDPWIQYVCRRGPLPNR